MTLRRRVSRMATCLSLTVIVAGLVLGSSHTGAQPPRRPYRVGVLNHNFPSNPTVKGLKAGIKAEGLEEERDVRIDVRSAGADEALAATLAAALAKENPDVIVTIGERQTRAVKAAAPNTPVVFVEIADPVAIGLVT